MRSILLYGCATWPVRVADERILEGFDNDSIRRILHVRRIYCVPSVEGQRRPCFTYIPTQLVQTKRVVSIVVAPAEDVGNDVHGKIGSPFRKASLRLRTVDKGLGVSL